MVEADRGYRHVTCRDPEDYFAMSEKRAKEAVAARHEGVNKRLEDWRPLKQIFRHDWYLHKYFFFTAAIVNNLGYQKYGPQFHVQY